MKIGRKFKITLIVIGAVVVIALGLAGWAYVDVARYNDLPIRDVDLGNIADGQYEGSFDGGRFSNSVAVTVRDSKIVDIKKLKSSAPGDIAPDPHDHRGGTRPQHPGVHVRGNGRRSAMRPPVAGTWPA